MNKKLLKLPIEKQDTFFIGVNLFSNLEEKIDELMEEQVHLVSYESFGEVSKKTGKYTKDGKMLLEQCKHFARRAKSLRQLKKDLTVFFKERTGV